MKILLINPNTSAFVTERMQRAAQASLGITAEVDGLTATRGPTIVRDRENNQKAAEAALALGVEYGEAFDAVLLGISTDAGIRALRRRLTKPVVGMLEAGLLSACQLGERVGLLTLGAQMLPLYQEQAEVYGLNARVPGWSAMELPAAYGQAPGPEVFAAVRHHAATMVTKFKLDVLVLAGAVLAGCRPLVQPGIPVPVVDGIEAAAWQAVAMIGMCAMPDQGNPPTIKVEQK